MSPSALPRVLVAIPFDAAGVECLREAAAVDLRPDLPPGELESVIGDYQALIVGSETFVADRTIEYAYQLQVIGVAGSSLEHLNVSAARAQGVEIINVPDRRTLALAEQTMRLLLTLALTGRAGSASLAGATLGLVGFGRVGHEVARRARAFDMRVLVHQPRLTPELALEAGVAQRELHALLAEADFVSVHVPTRPETRRLIGARELQACRPSAYIINAGSPEAVELPALQAALQAGRLAGAALLLQPGLQRAGQALPEHPNLLVAEAAGPNRAEVERDIALKLAQLVRAHLRARRASNPLALRVAPLEHVLPHECFDPERVADLAARLQNEATLVNPPVVVEWEGKFVVLDGATRVTAFKQLGYPHIIVQVVDSDDERLVLHTWYHAVVGPPAGALLARLRARSEFNLLPAPRDAHQAALDAKQAVCSLLTPADGSYLVRPAEGADPLTALNALVAAYTEVGSVTRTLATDLAALAAEAPNFAALVIFPQFTLADVLGAAVGGQLLPAGITRFVIPGRVLRLHADLERLRAEEPLARKNAWLNQLLAEKLARRSVRFYQEPVVLLDE